ELVVARPPIGLGQGPARRDPAAGLEPGEAGVERAHVELQRAARDLLQPRGDGVAVLRPERGQRLQDHEVERPLQDDGACIRHANGAYAGPFGCQMETRPKELLAWRMRLRLALLLLLVPQLVAAAERPLYYERALTAADLDGRTLRELSLMRNTIYA